MTYLSASNAQSPILHGCNDKPRTTESGEQGLMNCEVTSSVHAIHYMPIGRQDKQVNRLIAEKESDGNANLNWWDELQRTKEYIAYHERFVEMLSQFENMWIWGMPTSVRSIVYSSESSSNN